MPDVTALDPEQVVVRYDEPSDTLFVHFFGTGVPGVSVQVDEHVFVRLDESEQKIIGLQIESYLHSATLARPDLLALATFADLSSDTVKRWRQRTETERARLGAINAVVQDWPEILDRSS